jgi:hypothetical protein
VFRYAGGMRLVRFAEIQGVTLIILDDKLACAPVRVMNVFYERDTRFTHFLRGSHNVRNGKIQMEVTAMQDIVDRGIPGVDPLEMKQLAPSANAGVEVIVQKLEREAWE